MLLHLLLAVLCPAAYHPPKNAAPVTIVERADGLYLAGNWFEPGLPHPNDWKVVVTDPLVLGQIRSRIPPHKVRCENFEVRVEYLVDLATGARTAHVKGVHSR